MVYNSEMLLIEAVQADANTLPGSQRHTFLCSSCHDVERRLVFTGVKTITATVRPDLSARNVSAGGAPNAWARAVEKLLTRQAQSGQTATNEGPLLSKTSDVVSAFNRSPITRRKSRRPAPLAIKLSARSREPLSLRMSATHVIKDAWRTVAPAERNSNAPQEHPNIKVRL